MNKQIEVLAKQAAEYAIEFAAQDQALYMPKLMEKFAELIVRECINIGDNYEEILGNEPECFNCRKVAYGIVDKIKNHFGVGE